MNQCNVLFCAFVNGVHPNLPMCKTKYIIKHLKNIFVRFAVFGGALTVMGGCIVMEMGAPRRDENGAIVEDEFSPMPIVLQYLRRTWKELTFYEKVM